MCPCNALKISDASSSGRGGTIPPVRGLIQHLITLSKNYWMSETGDTTSDRVELPGWSLQVADESVIQLPTGLSVSVVLDAWTSLARTTALVEGVDWTFDEDHYTITFHTSGYVYGILTYDATSTLLDRFPLTESSGTTIYTVTRANFPATLSADIAWTSQSTVASYANTYGYKLVTSVYVPSLLDQTGWANGDVTGGYLGVINNKARFRQVNCFFSPTDAGKYILALAANTEFTEATNVSVAYWGYSPDGSSRSSVGAYGGASQSFQIRKSTSTTLTVYVYGATSGTVSCTIPSTGLLHIAVVYDGSQSTNTTKVVIYLNGSPQSCSSTGTIPAAIGTMATTKFQVGSSVLTQSTNYQYRGVQVFTKSLAPDEVNALYAGIRPATGLSLEWPCCEGAGDQVYDVKGTNRGVLVGTGTGFWSVRYDPIITPYTLVWGYRVYSDGGTTYGLVPRKLDASWPTPETLTTLISEHAAISGGVNGNVRLVPWYMDFCPDYAAGRIPAEKSWLFDYVGTLGNSTWRGTRAAGGYGDYRDFTLSYAEILVLLSDATADPYRRHFFARLYHTSGAVQLGLDRFYHYTRQLTARETDATTRKLGEVIV